MNRSSSPVERIRAQFLARCHEDISVMMEGCAGNELGIVEALAHRMVGAAGALEEDLIAKLAREVMNRARSRDRPGVTRGLQALQDALHVRTSARQRAAR